MSIISDDRAIAALRLLLEWMGDDPQREGLLNTPMRVLAAWRESWGKGYQETLHPNTLTSFDHRTEGDQMIIEKDISFASHCEHHLAIFYGSAAVAYIPHDNRIIGLSKLARVVEHFAARLQVQERLVMQVADFIAEHVSPDCAVRMEATHTCMTSRGVKQSHTSAVTTALRGIFRRDPAAKQEFLLEVKK